MSVNGQATTYWGVPKDSNFLRFTIVGGFDITASINTVWHKEEYKKWKCDIVVCRQCMSCDVYIKGSLRRVALTNDSPTGYFGDHWTLNRCSCNNAVGGKFVVAYIFHDETVPEPKYADKKARFTDEDEAKKYQANLKIRFEDSDEPIFANRHFLSMYSNVFRAMFEGDFKEKNAEEIKLEVKREDFLTFLDSIYYPPVPVTSRSFKTIVTIADRYDFPHVLENCKEFAEMRAKELASVKECRDYIEAAERFNWDDVMSAVINLVKNNDTSFLSEILNGDWIEERNPNTQRALFAELKGNAASPTM